MAFIFKRKRMADGKKVASRHYHASYKDASGRSHVKSLGVSDRQVAQAMLQQIVREVEQESAGLIPSKSLREAVQRPLTEHVAAFVADLRARGRNGHYVGTLAFRLEKLFQECPWTGLRDITADSFVDWRARQREFSAKTLNEYLAVVMGLLNWMERQGRVSKNPLRGVQKVETRGREVRKRRAFTDEEIQRLLGVAGKSRLLYLAALLTGLRDKELAGLLWGDLQLDEDCPRLTVRASLSKNRRSAVLPVHPDLAAELRALRGESTGEFVFAGVHHRSEIFENHLREAGIQKRNPQGHQVDFHALRHTYCTNLKRAGVSEAVAMELMRHHDPRLTAKVYTDSSQLPLAEGVAKLSNHSVKQHTLKHTLPLVQVGQKLSSAVTSTDDVGSAEEPMFAGVPSASVTWSHNGAEKGEWLQRKDSNLQHAH